MAEIRVTAILPFPLRVDATPYTVTAGDVSWELTVERVQRTNQDERLAGELENLDYIVDRNGDASYSRVSGMATTDSEPSHAVGLFLASVNRLIEHARDVLNIHWIRQLELTDLFAVTLVVDSHATQTIGVGRGQGIQAATIGLTPQANARLEASLGSSDMPPAWRMLHLDALDALELSRHEDAVVLAWTALESACRVSLPGLAFAAGISVPVLERTLDVRGRAQKPSLSLEECVERSGRVMLVIEQVAALAPRQPYDAASLALSLHRPYRIRNVIAHQGVQIERRSASEAIEAISFFARQVDLRHVDPPPAEQSWISVFGSPSPIIRELRTRRDLRIVLSNPREGGLITRWWDAEIVGHDLWLRLDPTMGEAIVARLASTTVDSWASRNASDRPTLRVSAEHKRDVAGLLNEVAGAVIDSVAHAGAMSARVDADPETETMAAYCLKRLVDEIMKDGQDYPSDDPREVTIPIRIASYASQTDASVATLHLDRLEAKFPRTSATTRRWTTALRGIDSQDPHSICAVLRAIHQSSPTPWLDGILVDCPVEQKSYGLREWPLGQPP